MIKKIIIAVSFILILILAYFFSKEFIISRANANITGIVASNLFVPWSIDSINNSTLIFTERYGTISLIHLENNAIENIYNVSDAAIIGEGGLLGLAVDPGFKDNNYIYIYYTYSENNELFNKIARLKLTNNKITENSVILSQIPAGSTHNGGRIKFGPDNKLYSTTGDSGVTELAQNLSSLAGKILRMNSDGSVPEDNPINNSFVYSYGHRNPQGLAWDSEGNLWSTEHGPSAKDELNMILPKGNYGWPIITGYEEGEGLITPVLSSEQETWAPSGLFYYFNSLYFAGLRSQKLFKVHIKTMNITSVISGEFGRLRDAILFNDYFYILTSNRDGRNFSPNENDDLIIKKEIQ